MASSPRVAWTLLIDPVGIVEDCADGHTTVAASYTSTGRQVQFWFKEATVSRGIVLLQLHTSNLETPNPNGGFSIRYIPEVVCTHQGLVLLRLRSPHKNFPTDYFVYLNDTGGKPGPRVVILPMIEPRIYSPSSVGILRGDDNHYVVANLRQEVNPQTWQVLAFLDCYSSRNKEWSQQQVTLPFPGEEQEEYMCGWQTDLVIAFRGSLLWVDLWRGILMCPNLLCVGGGDYAKFEYVPFPPGLLPARPADHQRGRPQQFRSVGCCNGELKLVNLHCTNRSSVEVAVWTLQMDGRSWNTEKRITGTLNHPRLCADMKASCDPLPCCYPVLSVDKSNILYLTVVRKNKAWLLQINIKTWTLKEIANYPCSWDHRNPPYPSELYKYLKNWPEDRQQRWWRRLQSRRDQSSLPFPPGLAPAGRRRERPEPFQNVSKL